MIARDLAPILAQRAQVYPVVTLTGPRQSGKTTLCRQVFPDLPYVSLEPAETRAFAREDPRGFLSSFPDGAILDEVQRAPGLTSYLQTLVDQDPRPGRFILTGSQNFAIREGISQSLAGRTSILHLLPPSLGELRRFPAPPEGLFATLFAGSFPRIHDRGIAPDIWLEDYLGTYVQRDVRTLLNIGDLDTFMTFLKLCAGSSGQELNLSRLGADAGISQATAKAWLSVLEASFLVFRAPAWQANLRKRLVKTPKLHVLDSGLQCRLLGIQHASQIQSHPLRGAIFESWVASEILKMRHHAGQRPEIFHLRENAGLEVDLILQDGLKVSLLEAKSGQTMDGRFLDPIKNLLASLRQAHPELQFSGALVYGGDLEQKRGEFRIVPWGAVPTLAP